MSGKGGGTNAFFAFIVFIALLDPAAFFALIAFIALLEPAAFFVFIAFIAFFMGDML